MSKSDLLDQKVIQQSGSLQRVCRWWKGIHPEKGIISWGWSGLETVEEKDCIIPLHRFMVETTRRAA